MIQPIKIAILAMGGEGGGVLADWIVALGEQNGHLAQATSVPGVAQRTGATIYYVELFAMAQAQRDGGTPVLALMPMPGDVDVVLASELMEAGRAWQRGLVSPQRTTLITSTHRVYAIDEKSALGDGRADSAALLSQVSAAAQRLIAFDMARLAEQSDSVVSAVLFGALAGCGVLPFTRQQFEAAIEHSGIGARASLAAFAAGLSNAATGRAAEPQASTSPLRGVTAARAAHPKVRSLLQCVATQFPAEAQALLSEGVRRLIDYQDCDYAALYLHRMARIAAVERARDPQSTALCMEAARHLALWMSYEDSIRVADLKTRGSRFDRVHAEVRVQSNQLLGIDEYLHPRVQEIADTLPAGWGRWLLASGWPRRWVARRAARGRIVTTSSLRGFLLLYALAGLRHWRRSTLRFQVETQRIEAWLADMERACSLGLALAVEVARCQRLVKGYGDTHERGWRNFERLMALWRRPGSGLAPAVLQELREAALADEQGEQLQAALARHALA